MPELEKNLKTTLTALRDYAGLPREFDVTNGGTVGRVAENSVCIPNPSISRKHAVIEPQGAGYLVTDNGSKNGTSVNGESLRGSRLVEDGDVVSFGKFEFLLSKDRNEADRLLAAAQAAAKSAARVAVSFSDASGPLLTTMVRPITRTDGNEAILSIKKGSDTASREAEKVNRRLNALYRTAEILRGPGGPEGVFSALLGLIFEVIPARHGAVFLAEDCVEISAERKPVATRVAKGMEGSQVVVSRTIINRCLAEHAAILTRDSGSDERFSAAQSIVSNEIQAAICVPLLAGDRLLGALWVDGISIGGSFSEEDLAFVSKLCQEASQALEHARVLREVSRQERLAVVGQTITGAAHNVKNLLQMAQGGFELLGATLEDGDLAASQECYKVAALGLGSLGALVRDMLDYSRGEIRPDTSVPLDAFLAMVVEAVMPTFEARAILLRPEFGAGSVEILAEPESLRRTLENLLVNAADCLEDRDDGRVEILTELARHGAAVLIRVRDNGPGVPPPLRERIFEPFFSTKGSKGTGLGLAMARKIITDHQGTIWVTESPGGGAEFCIEIPSVTGPQTPSMELRRTFATPTPIHPFPPAHIHSCHNHGLARKYVTLLWKPTPSIPPDESKPEMEILVSRCNSHARPSLRGDHSVNPV